MLEAIGVDVAGDLDLDALEVRVKRDVAAAAVEHRDSEQSRKGAAAAARVDDEVRLSGQRAARLGERSVAKADPIGLADALEPSCLGDDVSARPLGRLQQGRIEAIAGDVVRVGRAGAAHLREAKAQTRITGQHEGGASLPDAVAGDFFLDAELAQKRDAGGDQGLADDDGRTSAPREEHHVHSGTREQRGERGARRSSSEDGDGPALPSQGGNISYAVAGFKASGRTLRPCGKLPAMVAGPTREELTHASSRSCAMKS